MRGKTAGAKEGKLPDKAGSGRQAAVEVSKRPAAAGCRAYMRRRLVKEFPEIVQGFVEAAKTGSCAHVKLATELIRPAKAGSKASEEGTGGTVSGDAGSRARRGSAGEERDGTLGW